MRYRPLGGTPLQVSVLALGCGNFGGIGSVPELFGRGDDRDTAFALMDAAREHGITLFDTANAYGGGTSEEWVGQWLASRRARADVVLTTKVRNRVGPHPADEGLSARHIREQIDASLRRLGTDRVDLYLAHAPDPRVPIDETLSAFDEQVRAGKVRYAGLSNYAGAELVAAAGAAASNGMTLANLQSGYSLLDRAAAGNFPLCAEHGIGFTAHSPLAGGWLSGKYRAGQPFPEGSRMTLRPEPYQQWRNADTYAAIGALDRMARDRGLALAALALAWVLTDPGVTGAVIGPRRPEQVAQAVAALDVTLTDDQRSALVARTSSR
ncbi:MAG: aldo/keto reductase [Micromonosporaceae bacterium]|nr:aldo/keto reductase [Micromonosporaceae bacterium]